MAMTFYVPTTTDPGNYQVEIAVDDPGCGRLHLRRLDTDEDEVPLAGPAMYRVLQDVQALALDPHPGAATVTWDRRSAPVTAELARRLLPALTRAVLLAVAGSDRYEILTADEDAFPALCVNCNQGSPYDQEVTISSRCVEHGRRPFGQPAGAPWPSAGTPEPSGH